MYAITSARVDESTFFFRVAIQFTAMASNTYTECNVMDLFTIEEMVKVLYTWTCMLDKREH